MNAKDNVDSTADKMQSTSSATRKQPNNDVAMAQSSRITDVNSQVPINNATTNHPSPHLPTVEPVKAEQECPKELVLNDGMVDVATSQNWVFSVSQEEVLIPYTVGVEASGNMVVNSDLANEWDLTQGFPFPCPVVRDPSREGEVYIPGEILRQSLPTAHGASPEQIRREAHVLEREQEMRSEQHTHKRQRANEHEKIISLNEVAAHIPFRLSQQQLETHSCSSQSPQEAFVPEVSNNQTLKAIFAQMDRSMRSRFIGLKNSSFRVRDKVRQKRKTTYKEVAEELVNELGLGDATDKSSMGEAENLKRRVYDVLNVFEAVGLIVKDHKNVHWKGCTAPRPKKLNALEAEMENLKYRLERKKIYLQQLVENYNAMVALAERNRHKIGTPKPDQKLNLPFFLVYAPDNVPVWVTVTSDSTSVQLDFKDSEFQVCGDMWVLRQLKFHHHETPLTLKLETNDFPGSQEDVQPPENEHCPGLGIPLHHSNMELSGKSSNPFIPLTTSEALEDSDQTEATLEDPDLRINNNNSSSTNLETTNQSSSQVY